MATSYIVAGIVVLIICSFPFIYKLVTPKELPCDERDKESES